MEVPNGVDELGKPTTVSWVFPMEKTEQWMSSIEPMLWLSMGGDRKGNVGIKFTKGMLWDL